MRNRFFINPIRAYRRYKGRTRYLLFVRQVIGRIGTYFGFQNTDYAFVHGDRKRLYLGENVSTMNTIFNVLSGLIRIGDDTIFGHNVMVLSGTHEFIDGKRKSLMGFTLEDETPTNGRDIVIGSGCFIGSGAIIIGPVVIGDNVIIAAGAVVTKDIESGIFAGGIPAKFLSRIK